MQYQLCNIITTNHKKLWIGIEDKINYHQLQLEYN